MLLPVIYLLFDFSEERLADIHKVHGLRGVYIATQLKQNSAANASLENLISMITFDKGGEWSFLKPPVADRNGTPLKCNIVSIFYVHNDLIHFYFILLNNAL